MNLRECLRKMGFQTVGDGAYQRIALHGAWYAGKVDSFHRYRQYNGKKSVVRTRATLGMAKKVCEDWANLLLNEKVAIVAEGKRENQRLQKILEANGFRVRANRLLEMVFALGTGAFVERRGTNGVEIDCVRADCIFPITWRGGRITECAFGSRAVVDGRESICLQVHVLRGGTYRVMNALFDAKTRRRRALTGGVPEVFETGSCEPLFQIITPNIVNNADVDSPLGISVFANALDVLRGIDLVYDSYQNEFRLGKKRILVPAGMAQLCSDKTGMRPVFDDNDTEFYAMPDSSLTDLREIDMKLRTAEHSEGLAQQLDLLSELCGLGTHRYTQSATALKTATEVISDKSAMFQTLKKHELVLEDALRAMARTVLRLDCGRDARISVDFDDSIIEDRGGEFDQRMRLVAIGAMQPWEVRAWYQNESGDVARAMCAEA